MRLAGLAIAAAIVTVGACASDLPSGPSRPPTPAGWTTTASDSGDLRLALPPWIGVFDTGGAIFANQPPEPGVDGLFGLLAEGPRAEPQPQAGETLERWLEARIAQQGPGPGATRRIELPAGPAVMIERTIRADTPLAWRFAAYAIETRWGVAFLLIDGPPVLWVGREADVALIPRLIEVGPGRDGPRG